MFGLGFPEIVVILIVVLLIFGPKKLPELAKSIGKGINEFKGALRNDRPDHQLPHQPEQHIEITKESSKENQKV